MGCDIHMVLERLVEVDGVQKWVGMHDFPNMPASLDSYDKYWWDAGGRNYELFAKLAGVRGDGPEPKGVPGDASDLTEFLVHTWQGDGHSHSYCDAKEFVAAFVETMPASHPIQKQWLSDLLESQNAWKAGCGEKLFGYLDDDAEYRVVFFFDN